MDFAGVPSTIWVIAGLMVLGLMFLMAIFARLYRKAGPHEALIVYGVRGTRIVKGHGTVILPMVENCQELSLARCVIATPTPIISPLMAPTDINSHTPGLPAVGVITQSSCIRPTSFPLGCSAGLQPGGPSRLGDQAGARRGKIPRR